MIKDESSIFVFEKCDVVIKQQMHSKQDITGFRCKACNRLLAKKNHSDIIAGEIKCPRCEAGNEI